jgi:hypothetical protein
MEVVVNCFVLLWVFFNKIVGDPYYLLIRLKIESVCLSLIHFVNEGIIGSILDNCK